MSKTLNQLMEDFSNGLPDMMGPYEYRTIQTTFKQLSRAFQPNMPALLKRIEDELNKFGYTLGELDMDDGFEDSSSEDFFIFAKATDDLIRNAYITITWEKVSGQQFMDRPDGSKLRLDAYVRLNEVTTTEMDEIVSNFNASLEDQTQN